MNEMNCFLKLFIPESARLQIFTNDDMYRDIDIIKNNKNEISVYNILKYIVLSSK